MSYDKFLLLQNSTLQNKISAAHCVTDYDGSAKLANTYQVAAGKIYSEYGDPRDLTAQYVEVSYVTQEIKLINIIWKMNRV